MSSLAPQFFLPVLHGGGAESHLLRILNAWPASNPLPRLWVAHRGGSYEKQLRPDVSVEKLPSIRKCGSTAGVLSCVPALRRKMHADAGPVCPVLDFAVLAHDLARRTLPRNRRPASVILLQNNLSAMLDDLRAPWKWLRAAILRAHRDSDAIVFLSKGVREDFFRLVPDYVGKTTVIPNAAWSEELETRSHEPCSVEKPEGCRVIVACGRMHRQKGFDVLLRAFAQTVRAVPSELWILGEGSDRKALETLSQQLGLSDSVRFLGFQANPFPFFRQADLFVLSSRWEGFGNVVVEALGCGTPVVSTDCPFGPSEILENGRWGLLTPVDNANALAGAIQKALSSAEFSARLSSSGPLRAREFDSGTIARHYANFLSTFSSTARTA